MLGRFCDGRKQGDFQIKNELGQTHYSEFNQDDFLGDIPGKRLQMIQKLIVTLDFQGIIKAAKSQLEKMKLQHDAQIKKLLEFNYIQLQQNIALETKRLEEELVKLKIHYHGVKIGLKRVTKEVQEIGYEVGFPVPLSIFNEETLLKESSLSSLHLVAPAVYQQILDMIKLQGFRYKDGIHGGIHTNVLNFGGKQKSALGRLSATNYSTFLGLDHYSKLQDQIYLNRIAHIIEDYGSLVLNPNYPISTSLSKMEDSPQRLYPGEFEIEPQRLVNPQISNFSTQFFQVCTERRMILKTYEEFELKQLSFKPCKIDGSKISCIASCTPIWQDDEEADKQLRTADHRRRQESTIPDPVFEEYLGRSDYSEDFWPTDQHTAQKIPKALNIRNSTAKKSSTNDSQNLKKSFQRVGQNREQSSVKKWGKSSKSRPLKQSESTKQGKKKNKKSNYDSETQGSIETVDALDLSLAKPIQIGLKDYQEMFPEEDGPAFAQLQLSPVKEPDYRENVLPVPVSVAESADLHYQTISQLPLTPVTVQYHSKRTRTDVQGMTDDQPISGSGKEFAWKSSVQRVVTRNNTLEKGIQVWIEDPESLKLEPTYGVEYGTVNQDNKNDNQNDDTGVQLEESFEKIMLKPMNNFQPPSPRKQQSLAPVDSNLSFQKLDYASLSQNPYTHRMSQTNTANSGSKLNGSISYIDNREDSFVPDFKFRNDFRSLSSEENDLPMDQMDSLNMLSRAQNFQDSNHMSRLDLGRSQPEDSAFIRRTIPVESQQGQDNVSPMFHDPDHKRYHSIISNLQIEYQRRIQQLQNQLSSQIGENEGMRARHDFQKRLLKEQKVKVKEYTKLVDELSQEILVVHKEREQEIAENLREDVEHVQRDQREMDYIHTLRGLNLQLENTRKDNKAMLTRLGVANNFQNATIDNLKKTQEELDILKMELELEKVKTDAANKQMEQDQREMQEHQAQGDGFQSQIEELKKAISDLEGLKSDLQERQVEIEEKLTRAEEQRDHFRDEAIGYYEDFEKNLKNYTANFEKKLRESETAKAKIAKEFEAKIAAEINQREEQLVQLQVSNKKKIRDLEDSAYKLRLELDKTRLAAGGNLLKGNQLSGTEAELELKQKFNELEEELEKERQSRILITQEIEHVKQEQKQQFLEKESELRASIQVLQQQIEEQNTCLQNLKKFDKLVIPKVNEDSLVERQQQQTIKQLQSELEETRKHIQDIQGDKQRITESQPSKIAALQHVPIQKKLAQLKISKAVKTTTNLSKDSRPCNLTILENLSVIKINPQSRRLFMVGEGIHILNVSESKVKLDFHDKEKGK